MVYSLLTPNHYLLQTEKQYFTCSSSHFVAVYGPVTISGRTNSSRFMEVIFFYFFTCTEELRDAGVDKHEVVAKQDSHTPQSPCSKKCISKEEIVSSAFCKRYLYFLPPGSVGLASLVNLSNLSLLVKIG